MAKLYFYYASMNAGKSSSLLQADFNYRERGMRTMVWTASLDTRSTGLVQSRIGLEAEAHRYTDTTDLWHAIMAAHGEAPLDCVLVDEAHRTQAGDLHVNWTPRGWMRRDPLLGFEQHLYLRQPGYGASYVTGGRLLEEAMAERARQLGEGFTMRRFFDEVNAAGMIPVSLIYWELTGDDRMVRELKDGQGPLPFRN